MDKSSIRKTKGSELIENNFMLGSRLSIEEQNSRKELAVPRHEGTAVPVEWFRTDLKLTCPRTEMNVTGFEHW